MTSQAGPCVEEVFSAALELESNAERATFVDQACGGDGELWDRVDSLLRAHTSAGSFLDKPALDGMTVGLPAPAEGPGTMIGPYKLVQLIGEGGFGAVYMAEQTRPVRRKVALKIIKLGMDTRQVIGRFEVERQALAMLDHPNIARVLDAGATLTGRPYFVMELVRGVPITEYCDTNNLSTKERLELFTLVCDAVQHAHQKGIIHRDIKPSNVMITLRDGSPVPKVIDFGIAKATNRELTDRTLLTDCGQFVGTPEYMSPEQAEMNGLDVDTRTDIYSLGVLLYELLTGRTPFDLRDFCAAGNCDIQRIIREQQPRRPSNRVSTLGEHGTVIARHRQADARELNRQLRGDLDWIVMRALEKDRTRRYETANALALDIQRHLDHEPVRASPPSPAYRLEKFVRRNHAAVVAGCVIALALATGFMMATIGFVQASRQRDLLEQEAAKTREVSRFLQEMLDSADAAVAEGHVLNVFAMLHTAGQKLDDGALAGEPEIEVIIRTTIGNTYLGLGLHAAAEPHLYKALEISRRVEGAQHARTLALIGKLAAVYRKEGRQDEARAAMAELIDAKREAVRLAQQDPVALNECARLLLTCEPSDLRDPEAALAMAMRANAMTDNKQRDYLDTLALAYPLTGEESKAAETQRQAIELLPPGDSVDRRQLEARLAQYEQAAGSPVP